MKFGSLLVCCVALAACGGLEVTPDDAGSPGGGGGGAASGGGGGAVGGGGGAVGGGGGATGGGGGATGGGGGATCDTWSGYGANFFAANCANCHHHSGQFGSAASVQSELAYVTADIRYGYMPQGYPLSAAELNRILAYLGCGAP